MTPNEQYNLGQIRFVIDHVQVGVDGKPKVLFEGFMDQWALITDDNLDTGLKTLKALYDLYKQGVKNPEVPIPGFPGKVVRHLTK